MDVDIDIEEHDVLENPVLRSIFPDLSQIKKEISTYSHDDNINLDVEVIKERISTDEELASQCSNRDPIQDEHGYSEISYFKNNVNYNTSQPGSSIENTTQQSCNNKIILGSRPIGHLKYTKEYYEKHVKPYSAYVYLKDIGSFLSKSFKFCKDCKIYFPQRTDLKTHTQTYHKRIINNVSNPVTRTAVHKRYRCEICLKYFFNIINFNDHMTKVHKQLSLKKSNICYKTKMALRNRGLQLTLPKSNGYAPKFSSIIQKTKSISTICFHCKKIFPSKKHLIDHIYNILQSSKYSLNNQVADSGKGIKHPITKISISNILKKGGNAFANNKEIHFPSLLPLSHTHEENNLDPQINVKYSEDCKLLYRCQYCTYYFKEKSFYVVHLSNKHKEYSSSNMKRVKFEPNCKFCPSVSSTMHSHNSHMQTFHKDCIENIIKVEPKILVFKMDATTHIHQKHKNTEIKKLSSFNFPITNDKISKRKLQISVANNSYQDINLNKLDRDITQNDHELVLKTVLFKCLRCDINFLSAKTAMNHLYHMEILINWKCSICQRIFKKNDEIAHTRQHTFSDVFSVYELNEGQFSRLLYRCLKCGNHFKDDIRYASHYEKCKNVLSNYFYCTDCHISIDRKSMKDHLCMHKSQKPSDFVVVRCSPLDESKSVEKKIKKIKKNKRKETTNVYNKMCYCDTCKCFLTQVATQKVHRLGKCLHLIKHICGHCGLVLTNTSIQRHRLRHSKEKQLKLQDFIFYNLKTGNRICPPVPEYPKCESCNVHFLSKMAVINHLCNQHDFLTCPICEIKLSDNVFKLHVAFHQYTIKKIEKPYLRDSLIGNSEIFEEVDAQLTSKNFNSNPLNVTSTTVEAEHNSITTKKNPQVISEKNKPDSLNKRILQSSANSIITKNYPDVILEKNDTDSCIKKKIILKSHLELQNITYSCSSCFILVNTFDKAVEHCQDHYNDINFDIYLQKCEICKINYDKRFSADHKIIHDYVSDSGFTNLRFDVFYFATDYKLWVQNMFQSIDLNIVHSILDSSIYKYEGRVKLNVIQEGLTKYVVYKCNSCRIYIDPNTILSHSENSCFRQRIHPCSFCGLPFISHTCRVTHETIHKNSPSVTYKSYKIVSFDRKRDQAYLTKILFSRNCFILYKCRGCNGIFDRFQNREHSCNKKALNKCLTCNLLLYSADYKSHIFKHTVCRKFTVRNMKIIFFGRRNIENKDNGLPPSLNGNIFDYSFIKCKKCNLCCTFKRNTTKFNHDCTDSNTKTKCLQCDIYLLKSDMNQHIKRHDADPYFVKENYDFIAYDGNTVAPDLTSELCESNTNEEAIEEIDTIENVNKIAFSESTDIMNLKDSLMEIETKVYKCNCGLHFLDMDSIKSHFGHCSSRISKQNCSKCNLCFTPKDLFAHLLQHHGDKKHVYKMNIIEMSKCKNEVIEIYKCSLCDVHFIERERAKEHNANCQNIDAHKKKCELCKLYFDEVSIDFHKSKHHTENVADTEVIIISTQPDSGQPRSDKGIANVKEIENLMNTADAVCRKDYKFSGEFLSQINVSSYSNVIYKCQKCNIHFNHDNTFRQHLARHEPFQAAQDNCYVCGLNFSLPSLAKHIYVHHKQMKLDLSTLIVKYESEVEMVITE